MEILNPIDQNREDISTVVDKLAQVEEDLNGASLESLKDLLNEEKQATVTNLSNEMDRLLDEIEALQETQERIDPSSILGKTEN